MKNKRSLPTSLLPVLALLALGGGGRAWGQIVEVDLGQQNPGILVSTLMGPGVSASNVTYQGVGASAGVFAGGASVLGINSGIILSTGSASGILGNAGVTSSTCNALPGDVNLAQLVGLPVTDLYDATVLSFDFIPTYNTISFQYVFASEEYNQYVGSAYNDAFGFFVNGVNVALIPGTGPNVSINNVNDCVNPSYFIDNIGSPQGGACAVTRPAAGLATAMNGLTTVLTATAPVTAGVVNHIELAISDVGDCRNDSNVFIQANSFTSALTPTPTSTQQACGYPVPASPVPPLDGRPCRDSHLFHHPHPAGLRLSRQYLHLHPHADLHLYFFPDAPALEHLDPEHKADQQPYPHQQPDPHGHPHGDRNPDLHGHRHAHPHPLRLASQHLHFHQHSHLHRDAFRRGYLLRLQKRLQPFQPGFHHGGNQRLSGPLRVAGLQFGG